MSMVTFKKLMEFLCPCCMFVLLLLWGCFDGTEYPKDNPGWQNDPSVPLIVKKAKDLIESASVFRLPDSHKPEGNMGVAFHKKSASRTEDIDVDWTNYQLLSDKEQLMALFPIKGKTQQNAFT